MGNDTRVTIRDIADRVGLSKTTVSNALLGRHRISDATRARVKQAAQALGYKPNPILAQLMTQMRAGRGVGFQGKLALVNANADRHAFQQHPTIPTYVEGCTRGPPNWVLASIASGCTTTRYPWARGAGCCKREISGASYCSG